MQLSFLSEENGYSDNSQAGFRLQRFEVHNWGGFNERPWIVNLAGKTGLLTGANGSGKTTLVDGLLTLLVPNRKRSYNQASGTTEKKDRDEKSYVLGAYGGTSQEESYRSKPNYLRKEGEVTVLLAYFFNEVSQKKVTLAQVLWVEQGNIKKFFVIAEDELSITTDFNQVKSIADLKKRLKNLNNVEICEEFSVYSQKFIKLFGLQSERALDLFNQTVGIKKIDKINDFVRHQMLEKTEVKKDIQDLLESYQNLTVCHDKIEEARKQLEILAPLSEEAEKLDQVKQDIKKLEHLRDITPAYFAQQKLELLAQELQKIEQQLIQFQYHEQECDDRLEDLRQQEKQLYSDIENNRIGQRLNQLAQDIKQCQKELEKRKRKATEYNRLAQELKLPQYKDSASFFAAREQGKSLNSEIDQALQNLQNQRDDKIRELQKCKEQKNELEDELESLRKRKNQIPKENVKIRDRLVRDLNLDETDLPFIGELLQVHSEAKEWEGVIERLLNNFGLSVLVPENLYIKVNDYVEKTDLRERLVYYRVNPSTPNPTRRDFHPRQVAYKLEIKSDNKMFSDWLQEQLSQRFNYVCCDTLEQFNHENRAITRNGLIKHGGERHEKDDRYSIDDRSKYILGWNNINKIKAIEVDLKQITQQFFNIEKEKKYLEAQIKQSEQQKYCFQNFMNFKDFTEIDWQSVQSQCDKLEAEKIELEANSDPLKQLHKQLEQVQQELQNLNNRRDRLIREIQKLESRQQNCKTAQSESENKLKKFSQQEIEEIITWFMNKLEYKNLTLNTIGNSEIEIIQNLSKELEQKKQKQNESETAIQEKINQFSFEFKEKIADLGTSLESLQDYLNLKTQIEDDDLPRHEARFKILINEKILQRILLFDSCLKKTEKQIKNNIDSLNKSLHQINYTDLTYIKLAYKFTLDQEIKQFIQDLKTCLGNLVEQSAEDNEKRFKNIQSLLIEKFKNDERWTNKVTDVRNWLEFSVSELYREDNQQKEYYTDSSGKSGGEKTKLAYTIFASAISYQFGINQENWLNKSLRFVVIDEVFSKLDPENVLYVINLFKQLKLQVLFVTPLEQINRIENDISTINYVSKGKNENDEKSHIISISIEEYKYKKNDIK